MKIIKFSKMKSIIQDAKKGKMFVLVDDEDAKAKWWKDSWEEFYPDRSLYLLIKFIPSHLEVVSYEHEMIGHEGTWQAPRADL